MISLRKLFTQERGHHGHRGRPGLRGGSQKGIGIQVPFVQSVLDIEHSNYLAEIEEQGRVKYTLGNYISKGTDTNMTEWHFNDFPSWVKKHPYQIHNFKLQITEIDPSISFGEISDSLAARWGRGLIDRDELNAELVEGRIAKRKK